MAQQLKTNQPTNKPNQSHLQANSRKNQLSPADTSDRKDSGQERSGNQNPPFPTPHPVFSPRQHPARGGGGNLTLL